MTDAGYDQQIADEIEQKYGKGIAEEWLCCKRTLRRQSRLNCMTNDRLLEFVIQWNGTCRMLNPARKEKGE